MAQQVLDRLMEAVLAALRGERPARVVPPGSPGLPSGPALPSIPSGFPASVLVEAEAEAVEPRRRQRTPGPADQRWRERRDSGRMGCGGLRRARRTSERTGEVMDHVVADRREKVRKDKPRRMTSRRRKPVGLQEEWRMEGHNKTDYMFLDFSK
jgi:hypothetical protein